VDRDTFEERVARGGFLEWTEFPGTGHLYGTPARDDSDEDDEVTILEIEIDGAQQVKRSNPDALMVLMVAPSPEAQAQRLRGRGDDDASVARRLAVGEQEEKVGRGMADYVVVNDDVDRAAAEVAGIIERRRMIQGRP
jgi:guanylate kinase